MVLPTTQGNPLSVIISAATPPPVQTTTAPTTSVQLAPVPPPSPAPVAPAAPTAEQLQQIYNDAYASAGRVLGYGGRPPGVDSNALNTLSIPQIQALAAQAAVANVQGEYQRNLQGYQQRLESYQKQVAYDALSPAEQNAYNLRQVLGSTAASGPGVSFNPSAIINETARAQATMAAQITSAQTKTPLSSSGVLDLSNQQTANILNQNISAITAGGGAYNPIGITSTPIAAPAGAEVAIAGRVVGASSQPLLSAQGPSGTGGFVSAQARAEYTGGPGNVADIVGGYYQNIGSAVGVKNVGPNAYRITTDAKGAQDIATFQSQIREGLANSPYARAYKISDTDYVIYPAAPSSQSLITPTTSQTPTLEQPAPPSETGVSPFEARGAIGPIASALNQPGVVASDIVYGGTKTTAINRPDLANIGLGEFSFHFGPTLGPTTPTSAATQIVINPGQRTQTILEGTGTAATGVKYNAPYLEGLDFGQGPTSTGAVVNFIRPSQPIVGPSRATSGVSISPEFIPNYAAVINPQTGNLVIPKPTIVSTPTGFKTDFGVPQAPPTTGLTPIVMPPKFIYAGGQAFANPAYTEANRAVTGVNAPTVVDITHPEFTQAYQEGVNYYGNLAEQSNIPGAGAVYGGASKLYGYGVGLREALYGLGTFERQFAAGFSPQDLQAAGISKEQYGKELTASGLVASPIPIALGAYAVEAPAALATTLGTAAKTVPVLAPIIRYAIPAYLIASDVASSSKTNYVGGVPTKSSLEFGVGGAIADIGVATGITGVPKTSLLQDLAPKPIGEPYLAAEVTPQSYVEQTGSIPLEGETLQTGAVTTQADYSLSAKQPYGYKVPNFIARLLGSPEPGAIVTGYKTLTYNEPISQVGTISSFEANKPTVTTSPGYVEPSITNPQGEAGPVLAQSESFVQVKNVGVPTPTISSLRASTLTGTQQMLPTVPSISETTPTAQDILNAQLALEPSYTANAPVVTTFGPRSFTFGQGSAYYQIQPTVDQALSGIETIQYPTGSLNKALANIGSVEYIPTSVTETIQVQAPSTEPQGPTVSSFRSLTFQEGPGVGGQRQITAIRTQPEYTLLAQAPSETGGTTNVFEQTFKGTLPSSLAPTRGVLTNIEGTLTVDTLRPSGPPKAGLPSEIYPDITGAGQPNVEVFGGAPQAGETGGVPPSGGAGATGGGVTSQPSAGGTIVSQRLGAQNIPNVVPDITGAQIRGEAAIAGQLQTPPSEIQPTGFGIETTKVAPAKQVEAPSFKAAQAEGSKTTPLEVSGQGLKVSPLTIVSTGLRTKEKGTQKEDTGTRTTPDTSQISQTGVDTGIRTGQITGVSSAVDTGTRTGQLTAQTPAQISLTEQLQVPGVPPLPPITPPSTPPNPPPPIPPGIPPNLVGGVTQIDLGPLPRSPFGYGFGRGVSKRKRVGVLPDILSEEADVLRGVKPLAVNPSKNPKILQIAQNAFGKVPTAAQFFRKVKPTQTKPAKGRGRLKLPKLKGFFPKR